MGAGPTDSFTVSDNDDSFSNSRDNDIIVDTSHRPNSVEGLELGWGHGGDEQGTQSPSSDRQEEEDSFSNSYVDSEKRRYVS